MAAPTAIVLNGASGAGKSTIAEGLQAAWPRQALLITVVRDRNGDGHAVLTVKTDKGEFILDNQNPEIQLWSETGYHFVKRQSQTDPNAWIGLGEPRPAIATATSR